MQHYLVCIPITRISSQTSDYLGLASLPQVSGTLLAMSSVAAPESDSEHAILSQPGSESGSESDSLDNVASRKRRKLSDDSTSREDVLSFSVNVPSRVKPKTATAQPPQAVPTPVTVADTQIVANGPVSSSFQDLDLKPWLTQSLKNMAIRRPTRIQQLTIPAILEGRDVIGSSRTGSGKTGSSRYGPRVNRNHDSV